ncbi:MAG: sugar phosphate isomerase/epimerase [Clostridia bacterium]
MSIGIRLHDAAGNTLEERAVRVRAQGFQCVHIALSKVLGPEYMEPGMLTPGLASYVRRALGGLDAAVLGCYLNLAHPSEGAYHDAVKKYTAHLSFCRWLNAGVVGTETGNPNAEYRYDPEKSHTEAALMLFIERVRPVVAAAEKLGATLAIEPVFTHIVCDPKRARRVLDEVNSPNLKIILDPLNLLDESNFERRDAVLAEALELLGEDVAVLHVKDYVLAHGKIKSVAAGTGVMDYRAIMNYMGKHKPHIDMTLEDTLPENAEAAGKFIKKLAEEAANA